MADEIELDALRAEAMSLGLDVDGRWGADRLRVEIEAARDPEPESEPELEPVKEVRRVIRAGGHVIGPGGWEIEREISE